MGSHEECEAIWCSVWGGVVVENVRSWCGVLKGVVAEDVWIMSGVKVGNVMNVLSPLVLFHVKRIGRGRYWE